MKLFIKYFFTIFCLINGAFNLNAQALSNNSVGDCIGAVEIVNYNTKVVQFSGGYGFVDELIDVRPYLVETNSVWIKLEPRLKGKLNISFTPLENYDFEYFLFKDTTGLFCNKDFDYIKLDYFIKGDSLAQTNVNQAVKRTLNCSIETNTNDIYYLLLHSRQEHQYPVEIEFQVNGLVDVDKIQIQNFKTNPTLPAVRFKIRDKETGLPVVANVNIKGMRVDHKLFMGSDFIFDAVKSRNAEIIVNAKGYFYHIEPLKFPTDKDSEVVIELEPLVPGKVLSLEGFKFEQNSRDFIPTSYIALKRLLDFMVLNESVKIEIIGHVNAPGSSDKAKMEKLSKDRAKTAYLYLIENGISKDRVVYTGKGNEEMVYPSPKNAQEESENRRVEIKILEVK